MRGEKQAYSFSLVSLFIFLSISVLLFLLSSTFPIPVLYRNYLEYSLKILKDNDKKWQQIGGKDAFGKYCERIY